MRRTGGTSSRDRSPRPPTRTTAISSPPRIASRATIDWASDPWHALTAALKDETGRKGKPLFLPLRRALTGRDHGPDMAALLPLIGASGRWSGSPI